MADSDIVRCDKCGQEITTGLQGTLCPLADQCELWPSDSAWETQQFAWRLWAENVRKLMDELVAKNRDR